jgi:uncharacterized integral membrane protein
MYFSTDKHNKMSQTVFCAAIIIIIIIFITWSNNTRKYFNYILKNFNINK